jgi:hypothetical protein
LIADELKDENRALSRREAQLEQLKRETSGLPTKKELAWREIQLGTDPKWVAVKYGFTFEEMRRAKEVHEQRQKEREERANRGNEP